METVFDVEPSSTTSTPTSLVSFRLHPGDESGGWGLQGRLTPVTWAGDTPVFSACPGYWGGAGTPGLPLLTQQDLAQVQVFPWPWLKHGVRRSSSGLTVNTSHPERREPERRKPERKYSIREVHLSESSAV